MRIAHIFHHYYPSFGGLEKTIQSLAEEQAKLGHEVYVVTTAYGAKGRPKTEVINEVCVHRVKSIRLHFPDLTIPLEIPYNVLKKVDIVQCYSQNSLFTYITCEKAKKIGKPVVFYFIGVEYLRYHHNSVKRIFGYFYQRYITNKVCKIADLILTTNEYEKQLLKSTHNVDAVVIPHGINQVYLKIPNRADKFRSKYNIQGMIIAYIGRLHPSKGVDILIRAFRRVIEFTPHVILVIVGRGNEGYVRKIKTLVKALNLEDQVRILGYIPEIDKIGLIDASEVIILPSRHRGESYPLVIDEAKARGKPLIVTNTGALPFRVKHGVEGFVIPSEHEKMLAEAIIRIASGNKSQLLIKSRGILTWGNITLKILKLYRNLLYNA